MLLTSSVRARDAVGGVGAGDDRVGNSVVEFAHLRCGNVGAANFRFLVRSELFLIQKETCYVKDSMCQTSWKIQGL